MMKTIRNLVSVAALVLGLGFAGTVSAATFKESLTSEDFLNGGYVTESSPLELTHTFLPDEGVASVDQVWIAVTVSDDWMCSDFRGCVSDVLWQPETAVVSLNGVNWQDGSATFNMFWGEISAEANIQAVGDTLVLSVVSAGGDFQVHSSTLLVNYTAGTAGGGGSSVTPSNAIPEPSAAMVFMIGGLTLSRSLRRRS